MAQIKVESLRHVYSEGTPFEQVAIKDINTVIPEGKLVAIIGHTGSGKSTFIQHLNGLLKPTSGAIYLDGQDINETKVITHQTRFRVGLVFQYPEYQLFEETVYNDIAFGPKNMKLSKEEIDKRVVETAKIVDIDESLFNKSPLELSGGQKRRVAIAGVMAMTPEVLILDEPTAGLDPEGSSKILENIKRYKEKTGATIILVSHSMDDVADIAERLIVFSHGEILMEGTPDEVFSKADELIKVGLDVPKATAIAMELKKKGIDLGQSIYTVDQLIKAVNSYKKEDTVC